MSFRESDTDKLKQTVVPDALKSDQAKAADQTGNTVDQLASYIPGQSKPRDALDNNARDPSTTYDITQGGKSGVAGTGHTADGHKSTGVMEGVKHVVENVKETITGALGGHKDKE